MNSISTSTALDGTVNAPISATSNLDLIPPLCPHCLCQLPMSTTGFMAQVYSGLEEALYRKQFLDIEEVRMLQWHI
ncbi:hypothetical protein I79_024490 [Cricetulus griseus]|uniref:Uncharacterized protein n=1 Tax=Cricetulus griseus TaxID=10029 RepID=G3IKT7_CRIGR|nr:hypothetical protein I79_024490 [Cricetulus griseus]